MLLNYNKTLGLPIVSVKTGQKLCKIKDFVIDYSTGRFLGVFCFRQGFIFSAKFFIKTERIKNFGENAAMIENETALENPKQKQNEKVAGLIKEKIKIKENKVLTESGSNLGKAKNYEVDLISQKLSKITVSGGIFGDFLRGEVIIPHEKIISIGRDAIIVKDAVVKEIEGVPAKISEKKELSAATMCARKDAR
jgi:uncharacterized protein YrrD